jgi:hypothetical protein
MLERGIEIPAFQLAQGLPEIGEGRKIWIDQVGFNRNDEIEVWARRSGISACEVDDTLRHPKVGEGIQCQAVTCGEWEQPEQFSHCLKRLSRIFSPLRKIANKRSRVRMIPIGLGKKVPILLDPLQALYRAPRHDIFAQSRQGLVVKLVMRSGASKFLVASASRPAARAAQNVRLSIKLCYRHSTLAKL